MVITLFFPYRQEKGVPGHSLSWRYQMTNKRAKCLLINQQTVLLPDTTQDESILQRDLISRNPARHIHTRCRDG